MASAYSTGRRDVTQADATAQACDSADFSFDIPRTAMLRLSGAYMCAVSVPNTNVHKIHSLACAQQRGVFSSQNSDKTR
ncbi:hypothetical protein AcV5_008871 [Taiwanofungus camphoratus]|nr:hypothetical protein AcV5_008871 [Antrodia cinnamomea]KAI0956462.1 hypothetical protein AcV7_006860 [Antrodia cinnamomea]